MNLHVEDNGESKYQPKITLSRNTLISVGLAIGLAVPMFSAAMWANSKLDSIDRRLERIESANDITLSKPSFESWALRLARDNPSVKVPEFHQ